jgi:hypothetical protein
VLDFPDVIVPTGCAVWKGDLYFGAYGTGLLYRLPLPVALDAREVVVNEMGAEVTDLEVGPDGDLYVATSDAIWRFAGPETPQPSTPSEGRTPSVAPSPGDSSGKGRNTAIVVVAGVVLAAGVVARFVAGRRLRRDVPED